MGQTLTNGVYLPDNGERNCYTGLSQNWQKLDNLIGSHGDTVSFSQTLTNGVEIGKITINGVDVSLYHTDYSDKADADNVYTKAEADTLLDAKANATDLTAHTSNTNIHVTTSDKAKWNGKQDALSSQQIANIADVTNKANNSDVVHKSGNESIDGLKQFNDGTNLSYARYFVQDGYDLTEAYSRTFESNYSNVVADGNTFARFDFGMSHFCAFRGDGSNSVNLGTSTNKWKTINGINPGALSLPNHNSYLDIKGNLPASVSDDLWTTRYQITPEQDGILILQLNNCSGVVVWNSMNLPSYGDRGDSICIEKRVMAFVLKGVTYNIVTSNYSQVDIARLFYCQGNV